MPKKLGFIADYKGRSMNSHVLVLVRANIAEFEKQHSKIEGDTKPDVNVKSQGGAKQRGCGEAASLFSLRSKGAATDKRPK